MIIAVNARFLHEPYSGIGQYLRGIVQAWEKEKNNEIHLFLDKPLPEGEFSWCTHHVLKEHGVFMIPGAKKSFWELVSFPRAVKKIGADVAFLPYPSLTKTACPQVTAVHDVLPWMDEEYTQGTLSKWYHQSTKKTLQKTGSLVTVSKFSQEEIERELGRDDAVVCYEGCAFEFLEEPSEERIQQVKEKYSLLKPYVLYVGGYDTRKNVDELVAGFGEHVAKDHAIDLVLVGSPLHKSGLYAFPDIELGDTKGMIRGVGTISDSELYALTKGAIAGAHCTVYEGFNIPMLQAVYAQIPMLAYPIPVHRELFADNFQALYPGHSVQNKLIWEQVLFDEALRENFRKNAENCQGRYTFAQTASRLLEIFAEKLS